MASCAEGKHAVDFSAPKACALFPDVATDDLLRLGVLKMAKQDPRKFKKKLDAGEFRPPALGYKRVEGIIVR